MHLPKLLDEFSVDLLGLEAEVVVAVFLHTGQAGHLVTTKQAYKSHSMKLTSRMIRKLLYILQRVHYNSRVEVHPLQEVRCVCGCHTDQQASHEQNKNLVQYRTQVRIRRDTLFT